MRVGLVTFAALAFSGSLAWAQANSFSGGLATTTGISDNVNLAPEVAEAMPGQEVAIKDGFTTVSPSLLWVLDNRNTIYQLTYTFNAQLYFKNSDANSYTNQFSFQRESLLTPLTRLRLSLSGIQGETNNFAVVAPGGPIQAGRPGGVSFFFLIGGQGYSKEISREWRFDQNLTVRTFLPLEGGSTDTVDSEMLTDWERIYLRSSLRVGLRSQYFAVFGPDGQHQVLFGPRAGWRRDFLRSWNVEATLGVVAVTSPDNYEQTGVTIEPTGSLAFRYRQDRSDFVLEALHDAQPNLQVGEFFITDSLNFITNYLLLREARLSFRSNAGVQMARELGVIDNNIGSASWIYMADAGFAWELQPALELSARYIFQKQDADPNSNLVSFISNTGLLTLTHRYPGGPRRQPNLRRSFRVDRSDVEDPFGPTEPTKKGQPIKPRR
jgi:hypothetical protein